MPYLTFIGPHAGARYNVYGFASRGYWAFRRGSDVVTRWGAVEVIPGRGYKVRWRHMWRQKIHRRKNVAAAKKLLAKLLHHFQRPSHGYKLLRSGSRILPPGGRNRAT
jgi:hypothetical protein